MTLDAGSADKIYYQTRSMCPECTELVPGAVVAREGRVLVTRDCPEHGVFDGVVCSDQSWYEGLEPFDVDGIRPRAPRPEPDLGCPEDCGLCSEHRQIAGVAAVEISNHCNASCPACLANNQASFELEVDDVREAVETLLRNQDKVDTFALSGGEPTIHPRLFEMLSLLDRPEIGRIMVNSNGVRIAQDPEFCDRLAEHDNVYVCLHYDGPRSRELRGVSHETQERALTALLERGIKVVPLVLAAQGVNDGDLGATVTTLLSRSTAIKSVFLSMMTYAGSRGSSFHGDPLTRLTIPEAIGRVEAGSHGVLSRRDFMPLPMPNPLCAAIGYFLVMDGEITPLIRHADIERVVAYAKNANLGKVDEGLERLLRDAIDGIYASAEDYPDAPALLSKLRRLLLAIFPPDRSISPLERRRLAEEQLKTVYFMQFMDSWSFDSRRLEKCSCQHFLPGGKVVPSCGYYAYHRLKDPRFQLAP